MSKRIFSIAIIVVMVCSILASCSLKKSGGGVLEGTNPANNVANGKSDKNDDDTTLEWTLNDDGLLKISGKGAMDDYKTYKSYPWYLRKDEIKEVIIDDGVTSIGNSAFLECENLTRVTIPNSVTLMGDGAFQYCERLTNITIPDSVTSIGVFAFQCCESLTSITIPNSVTLIGDYAFQNCSNLVSVTIKNSATLLDGLVFSGCNNLTIFGAEGSTAQEHAKENGHNFVVQ